LAAKCNAHINVELCTTVTAVKYLFEYVYKGHDRATVQIGGACGPNEIKRYLDSRFVSVSEGVWRIFDFELHDGEPGVNRLQLHLPGHNIVPF